MARLLVTRPEADARALAEALARRGHEAVVEPLMAIVRRDDATIDLAGVQALLFTSANGVRAFAAACDERALRVFAVGRATAAAARAAGFARVAVAGGDVGALAALVADRLDPAAGALVHAAGAAVAGDLAGALAERGFTVRREVLYEARPRTALSAAAAAAIAAGRIDGVLLFSPRTAALFVRLAAAAGGAEGLGRTVAFCLSAAVAAAAVGAPWGAVRIAERPDQASLLALIDAAATGRRETA